MLWLFKKQRLTEILQLLNCSEKLVCIACTVKGKNTHGGRVMLLIHRNICHISNMELENNSKSKWVKILANKSHYVASWYRQPNGTVEDFQLFRDQLDHIKSP